MNDVFYRGQSSPFGSMQVILKSALAGKARSEDVRKTCLKRALTACFSAISCAGHVMEEGWKGFLASREEAQAPYCNEVTELKSWPASCAGHVLELLTSKSTTIGNGGLL